jgi:hypothetical protein
VQAGGYGPGSGTGTISTLISKLGPSLWTMPALHSLGISNVGGSDILI